MGFIPPDSTNVQGTSQGECISFSFLSNPMEIPWISMEYILDLKWPINVLLIPYICSKYVRQAFHRNFTFRAKADIWMFLRRSHILGGTSLEHPWAVTDLTFGHQSITAPVNLRWNGFRASDVRACKPLKDGEVQNARERERTEILGENTGRRHRILIKNASKRLFSSRKKKHKLDLYTKLPK